MNLRFTLTLCFIILFLSTTMKAQDVHFAHLHAAPLLLNPSMTGLFNGDLRFTGNYRSQWNGFTNGYSTAAAAIDMKLAVVENGGAIGGGLMLISDQAGDLGFTTNSANSTFSYMKALDRDGNYFLSIGFQGAYTQQYFDVTKIDAFDAEPLSMDGNTSYWDFSTGLSLFSNFGKDNTFYVGGGIFHLNTPNISFYKENPNYEGTDLYRRYVLHAGADLRLSKTSRLKPTMIVSQQGPNKEINFGTFLKYKKDNGLSEKDAYSLYFGSWMRWYVAPNAVNIDALITAVRLDYKNLSVTLSFDSTVSNLRRASFGQGGTELSIMQIIDWRGKGQKVKKMKMKCPELSYK